MTTILVAVCCERCHMMIPPGEATRDKEGWLCRAHFAGTREASRRRYRSRRTVGRQQARQAGE